MPDVKTTGGSSAGSASRLCRFGRDETSESLSLRLGAALERVEELEHLEEAHRVSLENLHLHQEELRTQNDELRRAQAGLESARRRHQALFDNSPVAHFLVSANGMILKTNRAAADLLGLGVQELYGFHMPNLANNNQQRTAVLAFLETLGEGYTAPPLKLELFKRDGGSVWVELHGSRSGDQKETSLLLSAVSLDSRTALEVERALIREEMAVAGAVFEATAQAIAVTDAAWRIERVNAAFSASLGHAGEPAVGMNLDALIAEDDDQAGNWRIWRALQETGAWRGEVPIRLADGSIRRLMLDLRAVVGERGQARHYICLFGA